MARPEVKAKISKASKGRRHSKATRKKLASIFGEKHPLWKGGVTTTSSGYLTYTRSRANKGYASKLVHQVVAKKKYGRWTSPGEHIHHVDGDKLNNHPDNLLLMTASAHAKFHSTQRRK